MNKLPTSYDPYDLWSTKKLGALKVAFYKGSFAAKLGLVPVVLMDMLVPLVVRKLFKVEPHDFPHMTSMLYLAGLYEAGNIELLDYFEARKSRSSTGWGWGLPFEWYSKNGVYPSATPYITNTPYVMECLERLMKNQDVEVSRRAKICFSGTWGLLESLKVMYQDEGHLALSYGPVDEPRMVVNANSYAALAYALHAVHGKDEVSKVARLKAKKLVGWVIKQQNDDGSWFYYADQDAGNFIDCFHSCFVVKNLLKVSQFMPELSEVIQPAVEKGWAFIRGNLYDGDTQLCRRFTTRAQRDPFKLDLYDQAEYLGLLVDFGLLDEAASFSERVEQKFRKGNDWYCRIDIFGRRWGKNFLRWGIVPFWYHQARLKQALEKK